MELIVVTPPAYFEGEGELINQFFAEGLNLLHIRKPGNDSAQFVELMEEIDPAFYPQLVIHQHHELATEFSLDRLHYPEHFRKLLTTDEIKALLDDGYKLSSSIHELSVLPDLNFLEYVFFGPVFNSISKTGYQTVLAADFVVPAHELKVFAIGGVKESRLAELKRMNFDGAAVLGTLWHEQESPLKELKKLIKSIKELSNGH